MYSWASSSSPDIVRDKIGGGTYRRVGAVTPSAKIASEGFGFLVYFEDTETRTLGYFFYRRFLEKKNLEDQAREYLESQKCNVFFLSFLRGGRVVSQITSSSRPLFGEESLMDH